MSEPTRIRIIRLISGAGELRSCDLLPEFEITQPTATSGAEITFKPAGNGQTETQ